MPVFSLAMHSASEGDALLLSWGEAETLHHALVDLGRTGDYRALRPLLQRTGRFALFAISHIDADHIEGAVPLFREAALPFTAGHVWFNAHAQLETANARLPPVARERLGAKQAEKVTEGIIRSAWPWNAQFASGIVSTDSPEAAQPIALPGGLALTLLSPSDRKLAKLLPVWDRELARAHLRSTDSDLVEAALAQGREVLGGTNVEVLAAKPFKIDTTEPNGASIAFLASFNGRCVLMGADAHPDILEASLRARGFSAEQRLRLDCLKVSHHGSKANTSTALLSIIDCTCFAFSTDGSRHGHPDPETIARILKNDPARHKTLIFNFRQPSTVRWEDPALMKHWRYDCVFPEPGQDGIAFDL